MNLQTMIWDVLMFISEFVFPLFIAIAVVVFLWNLFRFAILKGATNEGRERARRLMLWGIIAFVVIVGIWGIVGILVNMLNVDTTFVGPDFIIDRCSDPEHANTALCQ